MGESKREQFIRLSRSGNATRQDYIDLSGHGFRKKSTAVPVDPLKYFLLMSGAFGRDLKKHGGIASLAPRRGRVVNPGGYAGELEIPEGYLEGLPNENYLEKLEEFLKRREHYERMKDLAPTQGVAQGGLARILNL